MGQSAKYRRKWLASLIIIASLLAVVVPATPALAAPVISLSPIAGSVGTEVTVTGSNFASYIGDNISVLFNGVEAKGSPLTIPSTGSFTLTFNIPEASKPGTSYVTVKDSKGSQLGTSVSFTIWEPGIKLDTSQGPVGTVVQAEGKGFRAGEKINFYYDGTGVNLGSQLASGVGEYSYRFTIPESIAGIHQIKAENVYGDAATTSFEVVPAVTITPATGAAGTLVTISGTGFGYKEDVVVTLNDDEVAAETADKLGNFTGTFYLPSMKPGNYQVKAEDDPGNKATASFTVSAAASLNPISGHIGAELIISGTGFVVGSMITATYDDNQVATTTTDQRGAFSVSFKTPPGLHGSHSIEVTDGVNTRKFPFVMESTPPPVPALLAPENGIKAKATTYFDWEDVTDPSGVTYDIQVATDKNFLPTAIVMEKTGLNDSTYMITEEEKLPPAKEETPYYWRARATDGADNSSDWSTPGPFYVGFSWNIPGWVIYFLIIIAVLAIAIFTFWMGRRTAYYRVKY